MPTLALWLDNDILAEKNEAAWEAALKAGGNRDYTLQILEKADHAQWEAKIESNAEMKSLDRFVPAYFTTIQDSLGWIRRFDESGSRTMPVSSRPFHVAGVRRAAVACLLQCGTCLRSQPTFTTDC